MVRFLQRYLFIASVLFYRTTTLFIFALFFTLVSAALPSKLTSQTDTTKKRTVYWLHDINDENSPIWLLYNAKFMNDFYMRGGRPTYTSDTGITAIGNRVRQSIQDQQSSWVSTDTSVANIAPIVIGHGLGGVVARSIEFQSVINMTPVPFRGIISIAAPNQGSRFVQSLQAPSPLTSSPFQQLTTRFLADISAGYEAIKDWSGAAGAAQLMLRKSPVELKPEDIRIENQKMRGDTAPNYINQLVGSFIAAKTRSAFNKVLFDDLTNNFPNSVFFTNLNATAVEPSVPTISIVSAPTKQSIYRLLASTAYPPHGDALDKHNDTWLITCVRALAGIYNAIGQALNASIFSLFTPMRSFLVDALAENVFIDQEFIKGARALEKDFPDGVSVLIGSMDKRTELLGYKVRRDTRLDIAGDGLPRYIFEVEEKTIYTRLEGDDGMLSETEQTNPKSPITDVRIVRETNHIGVTNNRDVRLLIRNNIFLSPRFLMYLKNP